MRFWEPIARGEITVTFRRWKRRQAVAGNELSPRGQAYLDGGTA
ncbi:MAG: hypothetical protein ACJ739_11955 [Acidimicrobiales bacterium]